MEPDDPLLRIDHTVRAVRLRFDAEDFSIASLKSTDFVLYIYSCKSMATVSPSTPAYENISNVLAASHLQDAKMEDSGTFEGESPADSIAAEVEQVEEIDAKPPRKFSDDCHIYANLKEMEELHNRPVPPVPSNRDIPKRNLNNGWMEYETTIGRTYFYNSETGKSQWIPPRLIRTPAQIQALLAAARTENEVHSHDGTLNFTQAEEEFDEVAEDEDDIRDKELPPLPAPSPVAKRADTMVSSFYASTSSAADPFDLLSSPIRSSPPNRSHSFKDRPPQLKNVPLPQVLPCQNSYAFQTSQPKSVGERGMARSSEESDNESRRAGSCENREPVRDVRWGTLEKLVCDTDPSKSRKREWQTNFLYLTSAHLIIYKDEKSAEKHGNHYAAPLGVCDLKGATASWIIEKDRKKRKIIQLELTSGPKYLLLLRSASDDETAEWFDALRDVISRLPCTAPSGGLPRHASILDQSCAVVRNSSHLNSRPHSTSLIGTTHRSSSRRSDLMAQSAIETTSHEEPRVSRETILERLKRFFRTRPSVESLKEKGIYKPEPVFGSTLYAICQTESSLVPKFLRTVMELIEHKGLENDGLYRVSGNLSAVQRIRLHVDQDKYSSLVAEEDVHVLTGALKLFFRELAEPLFPFNVHKEYLSAIRAPNAKAKFKKFDDLLKTLPPENRETLKMLLRHLHRVAAHSDKNRMQAHNLAIMFGPTLFHSGEEKPKKKDAKKKKDSKKDEPVQIQSNSMLASNMIMQGQIVEFLLNEHSRFEALQGPVLTHPS